MSLDQVSKVTWAECLQLRDLNIIAINHFDHRPILQVSDDAIHAVNADVTASDDATGRVGIGMFSTVDRARFDFEEVNANMFAAVES